MQQDKDILVGRNSELSRLKSIMDSNEAEFVVVYGRRRVGKTFLVNSFFNDSYAFKLTGLAEKNKSEQLTNFAASLRRYGKKKYTKPRTWFEAFEMLRDLLENSETDGKRVIFIDELPWIDTKNSNLLSALEHFWNDWAVTQNDIVLIVCGSATSWITRKILKNHGGLHNRVTQRIFVRPFTLAECKKYFISRGITLDDKEIAECYMIIGGIPFYLKQIRRGASLAQNIDEMFFVERCSLDGEFQALYASLFDNADNYIKIVEALSSKNKGLTRDEIIKSASVENNGHLSEILQNLIDCDFVRCYKGFGNKLKLSVFQLIDPFTLFYYKFIKKFGSTGKAFWQFQQGTHQHSVWAGLAFEQLCLNHYQQIERALGISGVMTSRFSWIAPPDADEKAQIDLIISRADKITNLCEMKFYDGEYAVSKSEYENLQRRIRVFRQFSGVKNTVHLALVTTYGLKVNQYSSVFQNVITLRDLFSE